MMNEDSHKGLHPWQYLIVVVLMAGLTLIEYSDTMLRHDLIGAPFLVIMTVMALLGDYISGILAILLGSFCIAVISLHGGQAESIVIRRTIEFFFSGLVIYILSIKGRTLYQSHISMQDTISQLEVATKKLNSEVRLKKKDLDKLDKLNKELRTVVDEVMKDKQYWDNSVKNDVNNKESSLN